MNDELISTSNEDSRHRKTLKRYKMFDSGIEPTIEITVEDDPNTIKMKLATMFNWYNTHHDRIKAKSWILSYVKTSLLDQVNYEAISACNDFSLSTGWLCRIMNRGINLPESYKNRLLSKIRAMENVGSDDRKKYLNKLDKLTQGRVRAQERVAEKLAELTNICIAEFEFQIDEFVKNKFMNKFDFKKYLKEQKVCQEQCKRIAEHFNRTAKEYSELVTRKNKDLNEGYSGYTLEQQKSLKLFVDSIISTCGDCESFASVKAKSFRKPRKKKIKTPQQLVKKLQYLVESKEFNLNSISPEKIIGATQIWVFNTKYRKLGVYNALDSAGLTVRGSTIKNFDNDTSIEKTLRKPNEILTGILQGSKPAIKKCLYSIKCKEIPLTGRINKDTIIVRIFS